MRVAFILKVGGRRHCSSSTLSDFESQSNNVTIVFQSSPYSYTSSSYRFQIDYVMKGELGLLFWLAQPRNKSTRRGKW